MILAENWFACNVCFAAEDYAPLHWSEAGEKKGNIRKTLALLVCFELKICAFPISLQGHVRFEITAFYKREMLKSGFRFVTCIGFPTDATSRYRPYVGNDIDLMEMPSSNWESFGRLCPCPCSCRLLVNTEPVFQPGELYRTRAADLLQGRLYKRAHIQGRGTPAFSNSYFSVNADVYFPPFPNIQRCGHPRISSEQWKCL